MLIDSRLPAQGPPQNVDQKNEIIKIKIIENEWVKISLVLRISNTNLGGPKSTGKKNRHLTINL